MTIKRLLVSALFATGVLSVQTGSAVAGFVDWTSIDAAANTAVGTLGSVTVTLSTTANPPSGFDADGGVAGGVTNGTFPGFTNPAYFTPSIPLTDTVLLSSSSSFVFSFSQPVTNLTLHLAQLADTTVTFDELFTLVSSDGDFSFPGGNSIRGTASLPDDANGSLLFSGAVQALAWNASNANINDGVDIQFSVPDAVGVSEPGSLALLSIAIAAAFAVRRPRSS